MKSGDIIVFSKDNKQFKVAKVLRVEELSAQDITLHLLHYAPVSICPKLEDVSKLSVKVLHTPIKSSHVERDGVVIGNIPVTSDELVGYLDYLKYTNFASYAQERGLNLKEVVAEAGGYYKEACALGDQGERLQAIALYTKAIELFPLFYEAIDNRAFTYMELGQWSQAIFDFQESLKVNPEGKAAFFSIGECLLRLGLLERAAAIFSEGVQRWPQETHFEKFLEITRSQMSAAYRKKN